MKLVHQLFLKWRWELLLFATTAVETRRLVGFSLQESRVPADRLGPIELPQSKTQVGRNDPQQCQGPLRYHNHRAQAHYPMPHQQNNDCWLP